METAFLKKIKELRKRMDQITTFSGFAKAKLENFNPKTADQKNLKKEALNRLQVHEQIVEEYFVLMQDAARELNFAADLNLDGCSF